MKRNSFIKKIFGYSYSDFNYGKSGKQAQRNRTLGQKIVRNKLREEMQKEIKENDI